MLKRSGYIWIVVLLGVAVLFSQALWPQSNLAEDGDETNPPSVVMLSDVMNFSGITQRDITASAVNGSVEFRIEKGTAAFDGVGSILGYIAIVEARNLFLPAPSDGAVIRAFDVSPAGAVFMPPLTLSVSYPEGFDPGAGDYLAWWNGGRWVELPSVVNTADATVTAKVRHFTRFAIIDRYGEVAAPTLPQTELGVTELMVTPEGSGSPHLVIVSVLVKNPETFNAVGTVTLTLNEKLLMSQDVALPGQGERKLVFTVAPDGPGRHRISVNQVGETFVVSQ